MTVYQPAALMFSMKLESEPKMKKKMEKKKTLEEFYGR